MSISNILKIFFFSITATLAAAAWQGCTPGNIARLSPGEFDSLSNVYYEDAATLAVRAMKEGPGDKVWLDKGYTNYYLDRLVDLYVYAGQHHEEDSVYMIRDIHTSGNPGIYRMMLNADTNAVWLANWQNNAPSTGNIDANTLIERYRLKLERYRAAGTGIFAVVSTPEPANTYALSDMLMKLPGVRVAEPETTIGYSEEIKAYNKDGKLIFEYMMGSGDCQAGCIYKKYWRFAMDEDRAIEYLGSEGSLGADAGQVE